MKYYQTINLENLHRPRLCGLLNKCMRFPLITIDAGTGSGKSIAVKQYLETYHKKHLLMRLNHLDNIPEQFWLKYTKIIAKHDKVIAEELEYQGFPFSNSEISCCLHTIIKNRDLDEDLCFIMDGFHLITEPSILRFIEALLEIEIENLHVILISALQHRLPLDPFYQAGMISGITKEDLCFTKAEITEYFDQLDIEYTPDLIGWVLQFSEGWAFAIKLIAFFLRENRSKAEISQKALPTIFELMDTFAFKSYSKSYKNILAALSYLHTIPIQLVMSITRLGYDDILSLADSNPFIRYDAGFSTIELHKIYLMFLKTKRIYLTTDTAANLFRNIADWYYEHDYIYEALDFYKRSGHYEKVCQIIGEFCNKRLSHDMSKYLIRTITEIPPDIQVDYHNLPLYQAMFYFNINETLTAEDILRAYEIRLLQRSDDPEAQELLGETYLLLGLVRLFMRELDFGLYFKWADGKLPDGSRILNSGYPLLEINHGLLTRSLSKEDVGHTLAALEDGMPYFIRLTRGCGAGLAELAYGEYEFYRGNFRTAEKYLYDALFHAKAHLQADIVLNAYFRLLRVGIARGNCDLALEYVDKIRHFKDQTDFPNRDYPLIDIALGWLSLKMGSSANIASWLLADNINSDNISMRNEGRNLTMYAHWLLAVKQSPEEALAYINRLEEVFIERNLPTSLVYIYQLRYTAYKMLKRSEEECFAILEFLYDQLKDSDFIMFIVENGASARTALTAYRKYKNRRIPDEWTDRVLTKATTYSKYMNTFKLKYQKAMDCLPEAPLTNNERSLLDGLCYGLSRAELADENCISENTVKSQLKNIYNKLNATNQAEAVYIYTSMYLST